MKNFWQSTSYQDSNYLTKCQALIDSNKAVVNLDWFINFLAHNFILAMEIYVKLSLFMHSKILTLKISFK